MVQHVHSQQYQSRLTAALNDTDQLRTQLTREITCLENQLSRVRRRLNGGSSLNSYTYEEMIASRKYMLTQMS